MEQQELIQNLIDRLDRLEAKPTLAEKQEHLRDYFAGQVLAGMMACPSDGTGLEDIDKQYAKHAYRIANLMLKAKPNEVNDECCGGKNGLD